MKVLCAEYSSKGEAVIVPVGDDVLLRNNEDFYFPPFTAALSGVPQLVLRISKLGKGIGERFASRYYDKIGVGVRFYADTLENELRRKELPLIVASSFDNSAAISVMKPLPASSVNYTMWVNGELVFEGNPEGLPLSFDGLLALSSDYHMIKIGDFIFCGNLFRYKGLQINDRIRVYLGEDKLLDFHIR